MKWANPGHEFDDVYENIKNIKKVYLFGAGRDGKAVYDILTTWLKNEFEILGFVDNDINKQGMNYCSLPVFNFDEIHLDTHTAIIISMTGARISKEIINQLRSYGFKKNISFFHYSVFLSVFFAYEKDKLFIPNISFIPSTRCNLNCKACLNFTPYMKSVEVREINEVKRDVDLFFSAVDYIELFQISGGEPLLYRDLPELIRYIAENYLDQIHSLETITNGTVLPSDEFLTVYKEFPITITIDDYREQVPLAKEHFDNVIASLESAGGEGSYKIQSYDYWIDLAPMKTDNSSMSEETLSRYFDDCHDLMQEYKEGRFYLCNYAKYAEVADIIPTLSKEEYFDISNYNRTKDLKKLMEFRLGYSEKGYSEFCKHCAGHFAINPYKVLPGEQA